MILSKVTSSGVNQSGLTDRWFVDVIVDDDAMKIVTGCLMSPEDEVPVLQDVAEE